jgi:hypothetical protein
MKSHSIVVSDADMDRLSRLVILSTQTYLQASLPSSRRWGSLYSDVDSETSPKQEYVEGSGGHESSACCTEQVGDEPGHIKRKGRASFNPEDPNGVIGGVILFDISRRAL